MGPASFVQGNAKAFDEFGKVVEMRFGAIESKIGMADGCAYTPGESDIT